MRVGGGEDRLQGKSPPCPPQKDLTQARACGDPRRPRGPGLTQCHSFPPMHEDRAAPRAPRGPLPQPTPTPGLLPGPSLLAGSPVPTTPCPLLHADSWCVRLAGRAGWEQGLCCPRAQDAVIPLVITQSPPAYVGITGGLEGKALALMKGLGANPPGFSPALLSRPAGCAARKWSGLPPPEPCGPPSPV